ncbi:MAG: glycosyl transferase, partial [Alphaproteobacteria bacterium]
MARIAYILLCHKDPAGIIAQAQRLSEQGDYIAIHFDKNARQSDYNEIYSALKSNDNIVFTKRRVKCGWGEWSLVDATLEAVRTAEAKFPDASHFYMLSGDCMPIKSAQHIHAFLDRHDVDYIESYDFFASDWIKIGLKEERLIYRHWFNERNNKALFYASMKLQQHLGLERAVPSDIAMHIGSQWWCLRRRTIEWLLDFVKKRRDVMRFFSTTWIPDETFFQTLV